MEAPYGKGQLWSMSFSDDGFNLRNAVLHGGAGCKRRRAFEHTIFRRIDRISGAHGRAENGNRVA